MYRLTWKLIALFSLIPPMLATTIPVRKEVKGLENRAEQIGGTGTATWYIPGTGSCGYKNNGNQTVVALSHLIPDVNSYCGQTVQITSNGRTGEGTIVDTCVNCAVNELVLSLALFDEFATAETGTIEIKWGLA